MDLASGLPVVTKTDIVLGRAPRQIAITRGYDGLDRLISEVTPQGSVSYSYDAAGRRTSMSVSGQNAISYAYDNANRLTQITQGSANVAIVPDSEGRRQSLTLPNSVKMAYSYDAASQLTGITYTQGSNTLGSLSYAYDLAGRRMNVGGTFARTGVPQTVSSASYNVNNQLTNWKGTNLTYDANGNLINDGTNTYMWNARNQLVAISGPVNASFQYDAFGRRVSKTIGGTTQFLYDGVNSVQEISGTSASANLLTGGVDEYFQRTDSAGVRNYLTDALDSTLALADSMATVQTSYTFEPFGNTTTAGAATTNSFAFTGRELDPTGLYFYRARYYNPFLQRFMSEDPIGFVSGTNLYLYVSQNPLSFKDSSGLQHCVSNEYSIGCPSYNDPAQLPPGLSPDYPRDLPYGPPPVYGWGTFSVTASIVTVSLTEDDNGQWYVSGGLGVSFPLGLGASLTRGFLDPGGRHLPTFNELVNFRLWRLCFCWLQKLLWVFRSVE